MITALKTRDLLPATPIPLNKIEDEMVMLTLNENGIISECSVTSDKLLGYPMHQLVWKHISVLLPQLASSGPLDKHVSSRMRYLSHIGHCFLVKGADGGYLPSRIFFNDVDSKSRMLIRPI